MHCKCALVWGLFSCILVTAALKRGRVRGLNTNSNPYGEYLLYHFYHEGTPYDPCLSVDEINYYKGAAITIGGMFRPTTQHSIYKYSLWDATMFGITPDWEDTWDKTHFINVKYVIWHSDGGIHQEF